MIFFAPEVDAKVGSLPLFAAELNQLLKIFSLKLVLQLRCTARGCAGHLDTEPLLLEIFQLQTEAEKPSWPSIEYHNNRTIHKLMLPLCCVAAPVRGVQVLEGGRAELPCRILGDGQRPNIVLWFHNQSLTPFYT